MANTNLRFNCTPGLTLTLDLYPEGSDTATASAKTCTENTNAKGEYLCVVSEAATGRNHAHIKQSTTVIAVFPTQNMVDDTGVYWAADWVVDVGMIGTSLQSMLDAKDFYDAGYDPSTNKVQGVLLTDALTTNNDKTGYGLADGAITAAKIADGAIDAATFASDVDAEILSYIVDDATRIDASALNTAAVTTIPTNLDATVSSRATPTNITAGTITTVTNLTNAPTVGDFTNTMKTSIGTAVAASAVASVTGGINTGAGVITTLDGLDTAQDTQHGTTQTYLTNNLGAAGVAATEAGGTGDQLTAILSAIAGVSGLPSVASGTIGSTGNDTTHLHLDGLLFANDDLNDLLIVVLDVSTGLYHSNWISDWVLSSELATLTNTLSFTPQSAVDTYVVYAIRKDVTTSGGSSPNIELNVTTVRTS